jgi:hypothetical protein
MEKLVQGQCCKSNLERTDNKEEMSGTTGKHHWNKEPRLKEATRTSGRRL